MIQVSSDNTDSKRAGEYPAAAADQTVLALSGMHRGLRRALQIADKLLVENPGGGPHPTDPGSLPGLRTPPQTCPGNPGSQGLDHLTSSSSYMAPSLSLSERRQERVRGSCRAPPLESHSLAVSGGRQCSRGLDCSPARCSPTLRATCLGDTASQKCPGFPYYK